MAEHEITRFFSNEGTRNEVRLRVVNALSEEDPGNSTETERYTYYVETLDDGNRVYLRRPANLHFGFDFLVCVENANYAEPGKRRRNYPKHDDLGIDLQAKKAEDPEMYKKLYTLLKKVYECNDVFETDIENISFSSGLPVDHILKTIKWLFIEQDIRYWNYSGRSMTWGIVPEP
ncbi:hypothetical protein [Mycoplasmopsis gallinarum]|uniref:hypothetical protein n=1 Tax=Mycoplasmopsis gallinarum TaxID=29557 RepID=UPI000487719F|nr:hypothetical protein [Mycoplasmopsis gallinarum]